MPRELSNFYRTTRDCRKVIVVNMGYLGDSVHLIPAVWEIRRHYPKAEIHTLSAPVGQEVLKLVGCVDRAWAAPLSRDNQSWWRHLGIIRQLRRERFEVAINLSGFDRSIFITAATGARWRVGHARGRHHFWMHWLIRHWVARRSPELPVYEQSLEVLKCCGFNIGEPRWDFEIPRAAIQRVSPLVPQGAVHISLNASSPLKEWPLENWIKLFKLWLPGEPGLRVVASGTACKREQARLQQFAREVNDSRVEILPPDLTVAELAAVLQRCRVHIGSDSGALHLAAALGVPTLGFFRDYPHKTEWLPRGPKHHQFVQECVCFGGKNRDCETLQRSLCLGLIEPEEVLNKVLPLPHIKTKGSARMAAH